MNDFPCNQICVGRERIFGQQLIQHNRDREYIRSGFERLAQNLFRRQVIRQQCSWPASRLHNGRQAFSDTEVENGGILAGYKDIAGLDVSVRHSLGMRECQRPANLHHQIDLVGQRQNPPIDVPAQIYTVEKLSGDVNCAVHLAQIPYFHNMRMA